MTNLESCFAITWPGIFKSFLKSFNVINLDLSWMLSACKCTPLIMLFEIYVLNCCWWCCSTTFEIYLLSMFPPPNQLTSPLVYIYTAISPCAFAMPFLTSFLVQASLLPLFASTVYLAYYSRATFMNCMVRLILQVGCVGGDNSNFIFLDMFPFQSKNLLKTSACKSAAK